MWPFRHTCTHATQLIDFNSSGMSSPMETRKEILKSLKKSLGVGGTLVEGVLEIQGAYAAKTVEALHKKGYVLAKMIGK